MITMVLTKLALLSQQLFFILLGFLGMGFLIGFHELGHFLFAKLFKIRIPSFSLGFGPRVFSKKIGETDFLFSAIPFGGYVEIAGAAEVGQGDQKEAFATDDGSFASKPYYQKMFVMFGGILFNLMFAYFTMIFLFTVGIPKTPLMPATMISVVHKDSAAEKHELLPGDRIISIEEEPTGENLVGRTQNVETNIQKLQTIIQSLPLKTATIVIDRNGEKITKTVVIGAKETETVTVGTLGVEFDFIPTPPHSFGNAVKEGIATCNKWIVNTFLGFSQLFSRKGLNNVGGPIMIISMTVKGAAAGYQIFLLLLTIISINLAVLNLIPLPILDGGQILFYSIEALIRRPIPHKIREYIHIATWIMFMILFAYLSMNDISRIASPYIDPVLKLLHIR